MEAMNPPPRLFMRSVAVMAGGGPGQARVAAPIAKWIISLLERLIQKQVCVCGGGSVCMKGPWG